MNRVGFALLFILIFIITASVAAADLPLPATTVPAPNLAAPASGSPDLGPAVRGTVSSLPIVITSPGTYTLDRDYTNLAGSVAIDVRCSNVIIDGAGHTLDGTDAANSIGVQAHGSAAVSGVTVKNIRITDWSKGIYFWNARGRIEGVTASSNTGAGIMLYSGGDNTVITGCTAENNGVGGLSISYAPGVEIASCTVRSNGDDGIYVYASNNARVTGTTASGNSLSGIALLGSSSGRINGVLVSGCQVTANGKAGIYMSRAETNTVVNNRIENTVNTMLEGTEIGANTWNTPKTAGTNIVNGPYLGGNWWSGFSQTASDADHDGLADQPYYISSGNSDSLPLATPPDGGGGRIYSGMKITAPGTYYLDQDIQDEGHPIVVEIKCSNVVIEGNGHQISGGGQTQYCGVYVNNPTGSVTDLTIRDLIISNCYFGIYLVDTDVGLIERCRIINTPSNGMGLILHQGSEGNLITGNRILAASSAGPATSGIVISSSSQNTITNNEFNNPVNALFAGTMGPNAWNGPRTYGENIVGGPYLGGNYWAEPDGTGWSQNVPDTNNDGIGDGAYSLATGNTDSLPLVSRPVANFTAAPTMGTAPLWVQFTDTSTGSPTSWSWSFGDGYTSTLRNPTHSYAAGTYTVSLTVWDAAGQLNMKTQYSLITASTPPPSLGDALDAPTLTWTTDAASPWTGSRSVSHDGVDSARSGAIGNSASTALSTTVTGPATVSFWWKVSSEANYDKLRVFVDGIETGAISGEVNWVQKQVSLGYGAHTLAWIYAKDVSSVSGSDAGWVDQVTVTAEYPPTAGFTASTTYGAAPLWVQFLETSTGAPTSWTWSFGDGTTSTLQNPSHTYTAVGTYTVSLTVWNAAVLSDSEIKTNMITVINPPPTPASMTPNVGNAGSMVTITNLAGTGFASGTTVKLTRTGYSDLSATNVVVVSSTKITCQFAIPSAMATGAWNVVVTSPGGQGGTLTGGFTVSGPGATLSTGTFQIPNVGGTVSVPIVLGSASGGISGYRITVSLSDPSVADITAVAFPDWAGLKSSSALPTGQVVLQAVDMSQQVPIGATNVILATLTVTGKATGTTQITITPDSSMGIQNRNGDLYPITVLPGTLTVQSLPTVPGCSSPPADVNGNGRFEDVNGNGRADFADIVLYFNQMTWIAANEPVAAFDFNANGRIDFSDIVWLFNHV